MNKEETLIKQYYGKVTYLASKYSQDPEEIKDLRQEGFIGLLSAIRNFNPDLGVSFSTYSGRCISNRMLDYIKGRVDNQLDEDFDVIDESANPEEDILLKDYLDSFKDKLSDYEFTVLNLMLDGFTNACIAEKTGKSVASVYNASQRIRQKLSADLFKR